MKLYTSTTSPYARMVMLAALARGMDELQLAYVDPWTTPAKLTAINPLSQVPTLIADNGTIITNSPLILDYLFDHPFRGAQQAALAGYGYELLDQVVKAYSLARFQPANTPAHPHIARARDAVARGLAHCPPLDATSNDIATHVLLCRTAPQRPLPRPPRRRQPAGVCRLLRTSRRARRCHRATGTASRHYRRPAPRGAINPTGEPR